jgi:tryptophan synthase alpha chain
MSNRIHALFQAARPELLNVYFTAGFPQLHDSLPILEAIQEGGADLVEIGMPFSDPIADGPTIQDSSQQALHNGMSLRLLMEQLAGIRERIHLPLLLMGYLNPVWQFGIENFCRQCQACGIDGLILPDLPLEEYLETYKPVFERYGLINIFLITPQTSDERIRYIDSLSQGFLYAVSSASTTGTKSGISEEQIAVVVIFN